MKPKTTTQDLRTILTDKPLLGLFRLMHDYRLIYLLATLSLGVAAAARTGTYVLLGQFADNIISENANTERLPLLALGFVGLAAVTGAFTFLSGTLAAYTSENIARRLRNFIFDHIQRLSFTYHDQTKTGELIQRATSDIDAVRRFFAEQFIGAGRIFLLFFVNLIALLLLNWELALYSIVVVPFTIVLSIFFFKRVSKVYEKYQEQDAALSNVLQENLTGVRVVKAFARQNFEREKFDSENQEKFQRGRRLLMMHALYWPVSDILTGGQMLAGFVIGALMAIRGEITPGTYLAYAGMVIWIIWPIRNMGRLIVQMSTGMVSFQRVTKIIRQEREPLDTGDYIPQGRVRGEIAFKDVSFAYEDGKPVLEHISFTCEPGQIIALLGSTGSGKTTLANLLPRFYEYSGGSILLDGVELNRYPRQFLRSQIGIVEQEPFLFSMSIRDNISYGINRAVPDEEIIAAANAAAVHDAISQFPKGYDTLVGEKGVTLSGGQKQRTAIARTIIKDPRILILDDATSSVDIETEAEIRSALERLMQNRTTFIIAHRIQSVMIADKIVVLDKGRIIQMGTHEELLQQEGAYQKIFAIQTQIETELEQEIANA
ncbi:MAG: ABC transporter ATP-binding protein [Anaerolineales bacterium]|nr:ABC transporter ATP-binding protein [Anaerolineales bacterium]